MSRLVVLSVFLGCTLISNVSFSENALNDSKDTWLNTVKLLLPDLICKKFENDPQLKARLDEIQMAHEQCISSIPKSITHCQQKYYDVIPEQINKESAATWSKTLGECIGKDFAVRYLIK